MPCDLGYRSVSRVKIEKPAAQPAKSPSLDAALLERIGQDDPAFVEWVDELDTAPLIAKALERAIAALGSAVSSPEALTRRWQIELVRMVGELLDFELTLEVGNDGSLILEGEKNSSADVREFLRVSTDASGGTELRFEHFKSPRELEAEEDRFLVLADRLGVPIVILRRTREGQDIPKGAVHKHPHKGGKGKA